MNTTTERTNSTTDKETERYVDHLLRVGTFNILDRPLTEDERSVVLKQKDDRTVGFSFTVDGNGNVEDVLIGVKDWRQKAILGQIKTQERRLKLRAKLQNKLLGKGKKVDTRPAIHASLVKK